MLGLEKTKCAAFQIEKKTSYLFYAENSYDREQSTKKLGYRLLTLREDIYSVIKHVVSHCVILPFVTFWVSIRKADNACISTGAYPVDTTDSLDLFPARQNKCPYWICLAVRHYEYIATYDQDCMFYPWAASQDVYAFNM